MNDATKIRPRPVRLPYLVTRKQLQAIESELAELRAAVTTQEPSPDDEEPTIPVSALYPGGPIDELRERIERLEGIVAIASAVDEITQAITERVSALEAIVSAIRVPSLENGWPSR